MMNNNNSKNFKKVEKKEYKKPSIRSIGSAVKLTKGGSSNGGDLYGSRVPTELGY